MQTKSFITWIIIFTLICAVTCDKIYFYLNIINIKIKTIDFWLKLQQDICMYIALTLVSYILISCTRKCFTCNTKKVYPSDGGFAF